MKKKRYSYLFGLILLLVVAIGAPFFIPGPNGKPLMSLDRIKQILGAELPFIRQVEELGHKARQKASEVSEKVGEQIKSKESKPLIAPPETRPETLYKWRDKKGTWHFTNRPPPDGVDYEVVKWTGEATKSPQ